MAARRSAGRVGIIGSSPELEQLCGMLHGRGFGLGDGRRAEQLDSGLDAVLVELSERPDPALLAAVRDVTAAPIVALAPGAHARLIDWAVDAGIADVLVRPYDAGTVRFALEKAIRAVERRASAAHPARVLTVFSSKGGTGKSVVATSLAAAIARRGSRRVLLVDLDLQFGDVALMLGLSPRTTVHDLLASPAAPDPETLEVYTERHACGLDVLPAPLRPEEAELVSDELVRSVLGLARSTYDLVVVDSAPFFHGSTLASLDVTDDLLLVCTPDIPAVKNVRLALETVERLSLPAVHIRIVLNRAGETGAMSRAEVEEALDRPVDFVLPFDAAVSRGVNRGVPASLDSLHAPFASALLAAARDLFPDDWPATARRERQRRWLAALARS